MAPQRLCSLSRRVYRSYNLCSALANYKAEVSLSDGRRFTLYFCNEHMSKAFLIAQIESATRQVSQDPDGPEVREAKVKAIHFRFVQHERSLAAAAGDDMQSGH